MALDNNETSMENEQVSQITDLQKIDLYDQAIALLEEKLMAVNAPSGASRDAINYRFKKGKYPGKFKYLCQQS